MLLICGEIDLSVGMVFAFSTWIFYFGVTDWGLPIWLAVIVGLASASLVGLINGLITVMVGVPSFITTLGMAYALNGLTLNISGAFPVETPGGHTFSRFFGGSPYATVYWGARRDRRDDDPAHSDTLGAPYCGHGRQPARSERERRQRRQSQGRQLRALQHAGSARRHSRVGADRHDPGPPGRFPAHVLRRRGGRDREHITLGGSGTIIGAALGVLVLAVLNLGFTIQGISAYWFDFVLGVAIIASMSLNVTLERIRQSGRLGGGT